MNLVVDYDKAIVSTDHAENLAKPLRVSQLVALLKRDVEEKHRHVNVVGELSSFKQWRSGHCYFDIKDDEALLPAVMFKPHFARLPFAVKDGMEMIFTGRVSIYAANSRLQMIVESMEPLGQGALALAFEQLKEKLKNEGLFDACHKKPIKSFNQCVGLITSSHGAVLRDMVRILKSRMPKVDILFVPVRVQGTGASAEIANAIQFLDSLGACDVIIVGRGGGSLEDLWSFNEELVARAIFAAVTPIISAVGHETDTTISDFVADIRAATPTHAASLAVPELKEIVAQLGGVISTLRLHQEAAMRNAKLMLAQEKRRLKDPRIILFKRWQALDETQKRLELNAAKILREHRGRVEKLSQALQLCAPYRQLRLKREAVMQAKEKLAKKCPTQRLAQATAAMLADKHLLHHYARTKLVSSRDSYTQLCTKLDALSPLRVLSRGYSMVEDEEHGVLSKLAHFAAGQAIRIRLEDGIIAATVTGDVDGKHL